MEKKKLTFAIILPILFGPIGLAYSSIVAGIIMTAFSFILGIALLITNNIESFKYFYLVMHPMVILWSILVAKAKSKAFEKKERIDTNKELNLGGKALIQSLLVIFFASAITAISCQIKETNFLSTSFLIFHLLGILLIIITFIITESRNTFSQ